MQLGVNLEKDFRKEKNKTKQKTSETFETLNSSTRSIIYFNIFVEISIDSIESIESFHFNSIFNSIQFNVSIVFQLYFKCFTICYNNNDNNNNNHLAFIY